ncbi:AAA family ATPase [Streptomyces sp. NPDC005407]|uniref:AAA family ATPase n=1 Tax=Streptomyces sp. NPDC005407 TaxID=3155340 RepID=UPI0033ACD999
MSENNVPPSDQALQQSPPECEDGRDPSPTPFLVTKEHRRFAEFAAAVRRDRYIGLCYGPPGVGKTLSARHYAHWDEVAAHLDHFRFHSLAATPQQIVEARTIVYTPKVHNSPRTVDKDLSYWHDRVSWAVEGLLHPERDPVRFDQNCGRYAELVIVDEADRLTTPALEQLRDHHDRTGIGVILIGMPGIERRLARYPQLYSRVGFLHHYQPLSAEEHAFVLARRWPHLHLDDHDDFTTAEAVAAITRITGGNFRLTQRLIAQVERILDINQLSTVTREVVETARESLVIGAQ